jgi:phosphoglycolate phosphatase-like HAD superfamily hydrolase
VSAVPAIFFDLDGTLLDVRLRHCQVHREVVLGLGGQEPDAEDYWQRKRQGEPLASLLADAGNPRPDETAYRQRWLARIEASDMLRLDEPFSGVRNLLTNLAGSRPVGLVTLRQSSDALRQQLGWLGLVSCFTMVLSSPATAGRESDIKRELLRNSGHATPGAVMVGDTEIDLRAGRAAGLRTVGVFSGLRNERRLRQERPDALIESVASLPSALETFR